MSTIQQKQPFWKRYVKSFDGQKYSVMGERNILMMKDLMAKSCNLYQKDLMAHYGCVNAIEFSPCGDFLASGNSNKLAKYMINYFIYDIII